LQGPLDGLEELIEPAVIRPVVLRGKEPPQFHAHRIGEALDHLVGEFAYIELLNRILRP